MGNGTTISLNPTSIQNSHLIKVDPRDVEQKQKLELLRRGDAFARSLSDKINQVSLSAFDSVSQVAIFNSEGLAVEDRRTRTRFFVSVTAGEGDERISANESPGALLGFEFLQGLDVEHYTQLATERALKMLQAGYIDGRQMPVIMGNGFGGVIFHEACGHPLETEAIRRKASPFCDRMGEQIAHSAVTAIDDGTLENTWGSLNIDDEGTPHSKNCFD